MASPAQRALYGNIYNDSLGAVGIWKAGMFHLLIAVAVILTVIRHTRADEETGRTELIDSTAVGRYAGLTAALLLSFGASLLTGCDRRGGTATPTFPRGGSLAFGAALAGSGLVFTAVAAVAAQLSPSARFARGAAFAVLGAAFTLRAVGDAGSAGVCPGCRRWAGRCRSGRTPATGGGCCCCTSRRQRLLTALAYRLLARRDVGAGLIAERPGPARRNPVAARRLRPGLAAGPRRAAAVDRRAVPLRPADRQRRARHRRRTRRRGAHATSSSGWAAPARGAGVHRGGVHHAGHDRRRVRDLADAAAAPGGDRPAGRDAAGRRGEPNPLAGKPSGVGTASVRRWRCWSPAWSPG